MDKSNHSLFYIKLSFRITSMRGKPITAEEIKKIINLRKTGHSLPEIRKVLNRGSSTVFKYINGVKILPEYLSALRYKQGGSKRRANTAWSFARTQARQMIGDSLSKKQRLCIMACLYWGEGNKKELNVINSDPALIKTFMLCLQDIGVRLADIRIGLRIHENINQQKAVQFWSNYLVIDSSHFTQIEVIRSGKKKGKLEFGMCRMRVAKSAPYFKLLMSLIGEIKRQFDAAVVQRIEQGTPKP